jgi:hypothetical protein
MLFSFVYLICYMNICCRHVRQTNSLLPFYSNIHHTTSHHTTLHSSRTAPHYTIPYHTSSHQITLHHVPALISYKRPSNLHFIKLPELRFGSVLHKKDLYLFLFLFLYLFLSPTVALLAILFRCIGLLIS